MAAYQATPEELAAEEAARARYALEQAAQADTARQLAAVDNEYKAKVAAQMFGAQPAPSDIAAAASAQAQAAPTQGAPAQAPFSVEEWKKEVAAANAPPPDQGPAAPPSYSGPQYEAFRAKQLADSEAKDAALAKQATGAIPPLHDPADPPLPRNTGGIGGPAVAAPSPWMDVINPQARSLHNQASEAAMKAIKMREQLGLRQAAEDSQTFGAAEGMIDEAAKRFADQKQRQAEQARAVEEKYASAVDALDATEIDSHRWWNSKTTGQKIGKSIILALAGIGSGLKTIGGSNPTGRNMAFDLINQEMAQDVEAQKDMYARKGQKVGALSNLYGQMMRRFGDEDQAFNAAMALGSNKIAARLRTLAAARGDDEAKARAAELIAKFQDQESQFLAQTYKLRPTGGGGGGPKKLGEVERMMLAMKIDMAKETHKAGLAGGGETLKGLQNLSKDARDNKVTEALGEIAFTRDAVAKAGDLGGRLGKYIYDQSPWLYKQQYGDAAFAAQQSVAQLHSNFTHKYAGVSVNQTDKENVARATNLGDASGIVNTLGAMESGPRMQLNTALSGYSKQVQEAFKEANPGLFKDAKVKSANVDE